MPQKLVVWLITLTNVMQDIKEGAAYMCIEEFIISINCILDKLATWKE